MSENLSPIYALVSKNITSQQTFCFNEVELELTFHGYWDTKLYDDGLLVAKSSTGLISVLMKCSPLPESGYSNSFAEKMVRAYLACTGLENIIFKKQRFFKITDLEAFEQNGIGNSTPNEVAFRTYLINAGSNKFMLVHCLLPASFYNSYIPIIENIIFSIRRKDSKSENKTFALN